MLTNNILATQQIIPRTINSEAFHPNASQPDLRHSITMNDLVVNRSTDKADGTLAVHGITLADNSAAPEWIELLPAGVFSGRDGRGPYKLSNPDDVIAATRKIELPAGIPIDYDHATDLAAPEGRPAPAAGWIRELAVRDGAIWGRVEWTQHGAAAVITHEYRYISPVFEHGPDGNVARLLRAALTNNPNLYLTAISARVPVNEASNTPVSDVLNPLALKLCALLGIAESASSVEIIDAVRTLAEHKPSNLATMPRAAGSPTAEVHGEDGQEHFVPAAQFQQTLTALNSLQAARAYERAEHAVSEALRAGKLVPAQRDWAIAYCTLDFQDFSKFISRQPTLALGESEWKPLSTFGNQWSVGAHATELSITQVERNVCTTLGIAQTDFLAHKSQRGGMLARSSDGGHTSGDTAKG
jgi:phage I-like protein